CESTGFYPPWEFKENSELQEICDRVYEKMFGNKPRVEAIHAGLECGIFSAKIKDLDCISIGPDMYDIHSVNERLSISSTKKLFEYLVEIMKNLK
ncbi:MAG: M20/M25/M40 family metallo-hydrolase, partial [Clostridia bacterium]|nr:M20/M25/M40 family metallo-hydrolase [Clostridia bacterium]